MRLPAKCAGCGQRVELRIGRRLPTVWCDVDSNEPHECAKTQGPNGGNLSVNISGPEALFAPPARAATAALTGERK